MSISEMITGKKQREPGNRTKLSDVPEVATATENLRSLQRRLKLKRIDCDNLVETRAARLEDAAKAVVAGGELIDVRQAEDAIKQELAVLERAVKIAEAEETRQRDLARPAIAKQFLDDDKKAVAKLIATAKAFVSAHSAFIQQRAEIKLALESEFMVEPLRNVAMNPRCVEPLKFDLELFESAVRDARYL